jgi:hypothetical protein
MLETELESMLLKINEEARKDPDYQKTDHELSKIYKTIRDKLGEDAHLIADFDSLITLNFSKEIEYAIKITNEHYRP